MKLEVTYFTQPPSTQGDSEELTCGSIYEQKSYISHNMDDDMKVCTVSRKVDRAILTDVQITGRKQVDDIMEFLENLKPSLRF